MVILKLLEFGSGVIVWEVFSTELTMREEEVLVGEVIGKVWRR